jgi:hypothetical protein
MAIPISQGNEPIADTIEMKYGQCHRGILLLLILAGSVVLMGNETFLFASDTNQIQAARALPREAVFAARGRKALFQARARYRSDTNNVELAWHFGRACFDLAEWAVDSAERADLAENGIAACRQAIAQQPDSAAAHYYLGMNLGQLARTRSLSALKLVDEMEREFARTRALDSLFDYAGGDRNLGFLYRDAPAIGSIGSRSKARQHFRNAVELAPEYPENRLNLVETYLKWSSRPDAEREFKLLEKAWPEMKLKFTGEAWESGWFDWDKRFAVVKNKIDDAVKPLESPRLKND